MLDPSGSMHDLHVVHLVRPFVESSELLGYGYSSLVLMVHLVLESYDQGLVLTLITRRLAWCISLVLLLIASADSGTVSTT